MTRYILSKGEIHPEVLGRIENLNRKFVAKVKDEIEHNDVVVIGMLGNPHCYAAKSHLKKINQPFLYLQYGSYLTQWRRRNALKMWTGWPTFPMIFVKGQFIGGASNLKQLIQSGELRQLIS